MFELDLCYARLVMCAHVPVLGWIVVCDVLGGLGGLFGGVSGCLGDRWRRGVLCSSFELCFFVEGVEGVRIRQRWIYARRRHTLDLVASLGI